MLCSEKIGLGEGQLKLALSMIGTKSIIYMLNWTRPGMVGICLGCCVLAIRAVLGKVNLCLD